MLPYLVGSADNSYSCEYLSEYYYQGVRITSICKNDSCFINNINMFGVLLYTPFILSF